MDTNIDHDLYSRQLYVLGKQAMVRMTESKILIHGMGALGVEIAKNLVLAGVGSLTIMDSKQCDLYDLGSQFYVEHKHVQSQVNRALACVDKLKELNPYVKINCATNTLPTEQPDELESFLKQFNSVILTDVCEFRTKLTHINELCRSNGIAFILADVYGLFGFSFTDFGDKFEVIDADGEEYRDVFISKITPMENRPDEVLIETVDQRAHNLETGDLVKLTQMEGLQAQSQTDPTFKVTSVVNSYKFSFNLNMDYKNLRGGILRKVKFPRPVEFSSLAAQLDQPDIVLSDLNPSKFNNPYLIHILVKTLLTNGSPRSVSDFLSHVRDNSQQSNVDQTELERLARIFYYTRRSKLPCLASIYGGLVAQETLKFLTNKFTPIKQWFYLDFNELFEPIQLDETTLDQVYSSLKSSANQDRYLNLRECFGGQRTLSRLLDAKLFMVGCGAIGCEMLKNYALLGVACGPQGLITITDNDLIEKSNLNRQFLFRQSDLNRPKSEVAARAVKQLNEDVHIKSFEHKVCPQTARDVFNDDFFARQDFCVNALDNLEARRYMDTRCVSNQKALFESGTLGSKGHVQVILPHLTESYTSQKDPTDGPDADQIPYCTLKSFPSAIEHCIQWSRDKFESLFKIKPSLVEKFLLKNGQNLENLIVQLRSDDSFHLEDGHKVAKILNNVCFNLDECVVLARSKFEKYFSHKAMDILNAYPLDHLMNDGTSFWKLPKRPPTPLRFDANNQTHLGFVTSLARLFADVYSIDEERSVLGNVSHIRKLLELNQDKVPVWKPRKKHIETDESKKKDEQTNNQQVKEEFNNLKCAEYLENFLKRKSSLEASKISKLEFEKDNDANGHIDWIHATSNLRASMYSIEQADKLYVKKIAGKIVPAIATTTSCIAGFVSVELVKLIQLERAAATQSDLDKFRNTFLNLAISLVVLSEPGACSRTKITDTCSVSLWDKWTIKGNANMTLKSFIQEVKQRYSLTISSVLYGSKSVYMPVMPTHAKRLNEKMLKLIKGVSAVSELKNPDAENYVDLNLTYEECDRDTENRDKNNLLPPIRYFFY